MKLAKIYIVVLGLMLLPASASAELVQLAFEGVLNNDENDTFEVFIEYRSDLNDENPDENHAN